MKEFEILVRNLIRDMCTCAGKVLLWEYGNGDNVHMGRNKIAGISCVQTSVDLPPWSTELDPDIRCCSKTFSMSRNVTARCRSGNYELLSDAECSRFKVTSHRVGLYISVNCFNAPNLNCFAARHNSVYWKFLERWIIKSPIVVSWTISNEILSKSQLPSTNSIPLAQLRFLLYVLQL